MTNNTCLNCGNKTENKFCSVCGQKTDTHRLTPKHFFFHDIVHGVWHLDKGILFTLKEAITRPGQAALDYIKGKRVRYYNAFYLCLILIGLSILLGKLYFHYVDENSATTFEIFVENFSKPLAMAVIPLLAFTSKLIFKKMNLNIAEHFIVAGFAMINLVLFEILLTIINNIFSRSIVTVVAMPFAFPIIIFLTYFNFGSKNYQKGKLYLLSFLVAFIVFCIFFIFLLGGDIITTNYIDK